MSAPQTAPTPHQAAPGSPNQYHLHGGGVRIGYYPEGAGPLTVDGPIILTYQDPNRTLVFRGEQAQVVDVPELGTCVTVTLHLTVDAGSTTATLLIPTVVLPPSGSATVQTELITTNHQFFLTGLGHPQRDSYAVTPLTGLANLHPLPQ